MYLLDTNVVSELRKGRKADRAVRTWAQALPAMSLYLSVISIVELEFGILLIGRRDRKQGDILRAWMDSHVLPAFDGRTCLSIPPLPNVAPLSTFPILNPIVMLSLQPLHSSMA